MTIATGPAAGILLAAGLSTRMEGGRKLGLKFGATPIVRLAALSLLQGGVDRLFAVVGPQGDHVREALADLPITYVINPDPAAGLSSSLHAGVAAVPDEFSTVVLMPGDMPKVRPATVAALISVLETTGKTIAAPYNVETRGNPVAFTLPVHRAALGTATGDKGGREIIAENPDSLAKVETDDKGIFIDIDTQEDLGRISSPRALEILVRGAGEMATGIAKRLHAAGLKVGMTEISAPMAVRRKVSFCEAVYDGETVVEGVRCVRVETPADFDRAFAEGTIPLLVDPEISCLSKRRPDVLVDATIAKVNLGLNPDMASLVIAYGPGFTAGVDCHVVVETNRGHDLGRLIYEGQAEPNTGAPAPVMGHAAERVLRAPRGGNFHAELDIGARVVPGEIIATVDGEALRAEIPGVLRGLIRDGIEVRAGMKVGDVDPASRPEICDTISDKARALGGAALEAILAAFNR